MRKIVPRTAAALVIWVCSSVGHIVVTDNLGQAVKFFTEIVGGHALYPNGPFNFKDDWKTDLVNVNSCAAINGVRVIRCGHGSDLETVEYSLPDQRWIRSKNSDVGGHYIVSYVDDMNKAVADLKSKGVEDFGKPTTKTGGPSKGKTWVYFLAPWSMRLGLVRYSAGKSYKKSRKGRTSHSARPAE